jgi:hypothetical protein
MNWIRDHWQWEPGKPIYNKNGSTYFYIRAPQHLYLGIVLIIMGWLCQPYYQLTALVCYVVGSLIATDDLVEHTITDKTPLRWFFEKFNFWLK